MIEISKYRLGFIDGQSKHFVDLFKILYNIYVIANGVVPKAFENDENITILVMFLVALEINLCLIFIFCNCRSLNVLETFLSISKVSNKYKFIFSLKKHTAYIVN